MENDAQDTNLPEPSDEGEAGDASIEGDAAAPESKGDASAPPLDPDAVLNLAQAANYLDISPRRLNAIRRQRKIPAQRVGWNGLGGWRFRAADLMAYVANAADGTSQKPSATTYEDAVKIMAEMGPPSKDDNPDAIRGEANEAPIVRMANAILVMGLDNGTSDIHLEPDRTNLRVRIRVDGVMQQMMTLPKYVQRPLSDRFKVMADVPLYERASPHRGFIPIKHAEKDYNIRVSVVPSHYGESFVLHIMQQGRLLTFDQLGFTPEMRGILEQMALYSRGLLLIAGPSGAGRTTTGKAILNYLNSVTKKICTYEDLPELVMGGIIQTYRWKSEDYSPADAVSALMLHNPDVLFLGDLNDAATAKAAVDAAKTGVLVIATIAARDSVDALLRMVAYGVKPEDIANSVMGIVAQHLLPKVCPDCEGEGCDACRKKGRKGRIGVFEIRGIYENERDALSGKTPISGLRYLPIGKYVGQTELLDDARAKAEQGIIPTDAVEHLAAILPK